MVSKPVWVGLFACVWLIPDSSVALMSIMFSVSPPLHYYTFRCAPPLPRSPSSVSRLELRPSLCPSPPHLSSSPPCPSPLTYIHRLRWFVLTPSILPPPPPPELHHISPSEAILHSCSGPFRLRHRSVFPLLSVCRHLVDYCQWRGAKAQTSLIFPLAFWRESNRQLSVFRLYSTGWPFVPFFAQVCHLFYLRQH